MNKFESELLRLPSCLDSNLKEEYEKTVQLILSAGIQSRRQLIAVLADPQMNFALVEAVCWVMARLNNTRGFRIALMRILKSEQPSVRTSAVLALGHLSAKRSVLPLLDLATKDQNLDVRKLAIHALGEIGDKRATRTLIRILMSENEDISVRGEAAEALGYLQDSNAFDPLVTVLNADEAEVRFWAAFALAWLADIRAIPFLKRQAVIETAEISRWGSVRKEILWAITAIRRKSREKGESKFQKKK